MLDSSSSTSKNTGVRASCPIELSARRVAVRYGDPVSVNCSTPESKFEGIGWEATQGGEGLKQVSHLTWTVESLTDWNTAPLCFFNPAPDTALSQCSKAVDVVVYSFPDTLNVSSNDSNGMMKEKQEYHLTCGMQNVAPVQLLTLTWYKGDVIYKNESLGRTSRKEPQDPTDSITFVADRADDGVLIKCEARLNLEPEGPQLVYSQEYSVSVYYGPELTCPFNYTALEFSPHNLTCAAEGHPQPEVVWYKNGTEVKLPENLTRSDAGQYLITASNILSGVNVTVEVIVAYPPSQIEALEDSEVDAGSAVSLRCSSAGNPRPKYSWEYYQTDNVEEENEDEGSCLIIRNATALNIGAYTCHAWNERGSVSGTARVTVNDRMVVEYQSGARAAFCVPKLPDRSVVVHWQVRHGRKINGASWEADTQRDWDPRPACAATFKGIGTCRKHLDFTLYKSPDSVSIRRLDSPNAVTEGREFHLQCDVANVAPARSVAVRWYRGNESFEPQIRGSMRATGCLSVNDTGCDIDGTRYPLNVSSTVSVTLSREHSGAEFRCEALLDLGDDGPRPPPRNTSRPLAVIVFYKPIINATKLPNTVPVFRGYPEDLVCEADGRPPPEIRWLYSSDKVPRVAGNNLTVSEAGIYNCSATNEVGSIYQEVEVVLKEDYLPLIAGFVAVTVVAISVVFLFIYSIYYKNTRMRRYSLKNPKLNTHNGNVAHNGWDLQFPMTQLS
ncbi:vascular cell adhesion protein 1 [Brachionichthys hirsutus]|uniref:vascular cell adhesion protein 1 n=1 Tax=Brachionichthys hirsutus TaxID=412623 RepID=UPI003604BF65